MVELRQDVNYAARPMSSGEKYFAFLDRVVPMNMMFVADLDIVLPAERVERSWPAFSARRAVTRLRTHDDLTISDGPPSQDSVVRAVPESGWDAVLNEQARDRLGPERPMRCVYLHDEVAGRSRLVLVVHHAIVDGRVCVAELQHLARFLDGQDVPEHDELTAVLEAPNDRPWQQDRRAMLTLLREIAARNARAGEVQPLGWARPDAPRDPRFVTVPTDLDASRALFAAAKAHGTRAYPATAAAWLVTAASTLGSGDTPTFQLATPADLVPPGLAPGQLPAPSVSVLATRYAVTGDPWTLAPQVTAALQEVRSTGEDALFFELTRAASITDITAGAAAVARALASTPPSVSVTNLGIVDPGSDPEWVSTVCGYLAASPNNVIFVSGTGYRGKLVQSMSYDGGQLDPAVAAAIVADYRTLIASMGAA